MSVPLTRRLVCWALLAVVPSSLSAQALPPQTPNAILHAQGGVWVNGSEAADSTAIFPGDLIETKPGFSASLTIEGTSVLFLPESVAKLEQDLLVLDHGGVSVGTSRSFKVRVNCITVIPVASEWTQYDVTDVNGTVQVAAKTKDVNVVHSAMGHKEKIEEQAMQSASVHEGEQKTYGESEVCGTPARPTGAGTSVSPKWIAAGAGGGGLLLCLVLHCFGGGGGKTSISPSTP